LLFTWLAQQSMCYGDEERSMDMISLVVREEPCPSSLRPGSLEAWASEGPLLQAAGHDKIYDYFARG